MQPSLAVFLALLASVFFSEFRAAEGAVNSQLLRGLEALYLSTGGPSWRFNKTCIDSRLATNVRAHAVFIPGSVRWNFSRDATGAYASGVNPCSPRVWYGITCSPSKSTVLKINLQSYGLQAMSLPSELGLLTDLQYLNLGDNCIEAEIPSAIGALTSLTYLGLYLGKLHGHLPSTLAKLSALQTLSLYANRLSGEFSSSILGSLKSLTYLDVYANRLDFDESFSWGLIPKMVHLELSSNIFGSSISSDIGKLTLLTSLALSNIQITSTLPTDLGFLSRLVYLDLSSNSISGEIPQTFDRLKALTTLDFDSNLLSSTIPTALFSLSSLQFVNIAENQLSGPCPPAIGNAKSLVWFDASFNRLDSTLPSELGQLSRLIHLDLGNNEIVGGIPASLGRMTSLTYLCLATNSLSSSLPSSLGQLSNLDTLDLQLNSLTGSWPSELGDLASASFISVSSNSLSGKLPTSFGKLLRLEYLDVGGNAFSGPIPKEFSRLQSLRSLSMSANRFSSTLSSSLGSLSMLASLELQINELSGELPTTLGDLLLLTWLNFHSNRLSSTIPTQLGLLTNLVSLDAGRNKLRGQLPASLGALRGLTWLGLYGNKLTSTIPNQAWAYFSSLQHLDLQENLLSGPMPAAAIGGMKALSWLGLAMNRLKSSIPDELWKCTDLVQLVLHNNYLSSSLSSAVGNLNSLTYLTVYNNRLTGTIPLELGKGATSLNFVDVARNSFRGKLPSSLASLDHLETLSCFSNQLTGEMPSWIGQIKTLSYLQLSSNRFTKTLPQSLSTLDKLVELRASNNLLTSTLPHGLGSLTNLEIFDVSDNLLTGPGCAIVGALSTTVQVLQLGQNQFTGSCPSTICRLTSLAVLDLSSNRFFDKPPSCLSRLPKLANISVAKNGFSGAVDFLSKNLTVADISSNAFTAELPRAVFLSKKLKIFVASVNCFQGKLPDTICAATALQVLMLDGLSSGDACRVPLDSQQSASVLRLSGFRALFSMTGKLPSCLFTSLPNITQLHVAGNQLTGVGFPQTLPAWPSALVRLSLSHNKLTSSVPLALQRGIFQLELFDVSFNKLDGVLAGVVIAPNQTSFFARINRFSGLLSPSVVSASAGRVEVLEGNLIDCTDRATQLPLQDPFLSRFKCGSETFDNYMTAFGVLVFVAMALVVFYSWENSTVFWKNIVDLVHPSTALSTEAAVGTENAHLRHFFKSLARVRRFSLIALGLLLVAAVPMYAGLSAAFGTHTHLYAWAVTAAFKHGSICAIVFHVVWTLSLLGMFYHFTSLYWGRRRRRHSHRPSVDLQDKQHQHQHQQTGTYSQEVEKGAKSRETVSFLLFLRIVVVVAINCGIIIAPNVGYVFIASSYDSTVQVVSGLFLSAFKIFWTRTVLPMLLECEPLYFGVKPTDIALLGHTSLKGGFVLELTLSAFNTVIAPGLATLLADAKCFSTALYAPEPILSSYIIQKCFYRFHFYLKGFVYGPATDTSVLPYLVCDLPVVNSVAYEPTFVYGYQCSASLLQRYSPIFLLTALISLIGEPLRWAVTRACLDRWPALKLGNLGLLKFIPRLMYTEEERAAIPSRFRVLNTNDVFMGILQDFIILFTFGIAAPPLAIVLLASILCRTLRWHHLIMDFASRSAASRDSGMENLSEDCSAFCQRAHPLFLSRWFLVYFSSVFLSFFLFDTAGDESGWATGLCFLLLMLLLPTLLALVAMRFARVAEPPDFTVPSPGPAPDFGREDQTGVAGGLELATMFKARAASEAMKNPLHSASATSSASQIRISLGTRSRGNSFSASGSGRLDRPSGNWEAVPERTRSPSPSPSPPL